MLHGVQGLLEEKYIDLADHIKTELDAELLKRTPAAFLGSCRYKLPEIHENRDVYDKIFAILDKLDIEAFIYIGGNDSMDTIKKLSDYAIITGHPTRFIGCPKTIDNDLALTDHTPGYGSAAKYIGTSMKEIIRDGFCLEYEKGIVTIVEVMGRNAGWLTGATALSEGEDCEGPDLIYLPEVDFDMEQFLADVHRIYEEKNNVLIAVSEGIHYADGSFVSEAKASATDGFGHAQLGGLAARLAQVIKEREHAKVRGIELSLLQRAGAHLASQTDIDEAFAAGKMAVEAALSGETGKMVAFERVMMDGQYTCRMKLIPLSDVANYEKKVPVEWIVPEGNNVTQDFIDYALPLIQGVPEIPLENGLPRYARLKKVLAE